MRKGWYQHLERTGFQDIEKNDELRTGSWSHEIRQDLQTYHTFQARQSYYQWAQEKAQTARFSSTTDRLIWEYHSEGLSRRQIAPRVGLEGSWITRKIHKIKEYLTTVTIGSVTLVTA